MPSLKNDSFSMPSIYYKSVNELLKYDNHHWNYISAGIFTHFSDSYILFPLVIYGQLSIESVFCVYSFKGYLTFDIPAYMLTLSMDASAGKWGRWSNWGS